MRISTFFYTIRQGFRNIFRNKLFSLASIATITACLFLFGVFYAIVLNLQNMVKTAEEGVSVTVFFEEDTDKAIDRLSATLLYALEHNYVPPQNFYGIGGMKIFRDLIWLMQGMMKADHKFYKAHGQYDFPQKNWGTMLKMYLVGALISNPKLKTKMGNAMNEGMLMPYKKLLDSIK